MDLMDVEGVQLARAIFDDPVFDVALGDDDVWDGVCWIEKFSLLAFYGGVKISAAVGVFWIVRVFGEIEGASSGWLYVAEPGVMGAGERGGIFFELHARLWGAGFGDD